MLWSTEKKRVIGCIAVIVILSVLVANNIRLYKQNNALMEELISNMNTEWYQLYHLFDMIDKYYINNNFQESYKFRLYVNQACHHFSLAGAATELTANMRNLLINCYDPLFTDLSLDEGPLNKDKATELLRGMNNELMLISKEIIDMKDNEKKKLLDPASSKFIEINARVKEVTDKYAKAVDEYFKNLG